MVFVSTTEISDVGELTSTTLVNRPQTLANGPLAKQLVGEMTTITGNNYQPWLS